MKNSLKTSVAVFALMGAVSVTANQAEAAGFAIREQSAMGLGAAFAGAAAGYDNDLSSMFFNPASVTMHEGIKGQVDASLILSTSKAKGATATNALGSNILDSSSGLTTSNSGNIGVAAVVPSTYASYSLSERTYFGLSISAPFGLSTKADANWVGRYHGIESTIQNLAVNPVLGFKISPMLSVAAGPTMSYFKALLTSAVDLQTIGGGGAVPVSGVADGFNKTKADDIGFGFTAGLLFTPTQSTRIGVGFRSAVKYKLKGTSFTTGAGGVGTTAALTGNVTGKITTPETVSVGFRQQVNSRLALLGTVEWANWSRFKELRIQGLAAGDSVTNEKWKDSWYFSGGAEYKWNERTTVRAGAGYEISSVPDAFRTPRLPDNDRVWLSLGSSYKVKDWLDVSLGLTHVFIKKAPINLTVAADPANASRGNLTAMFKTGLNIASVSAKIKF